MKSQLEDDFVRSSVATNSKRDAGDFESELRQPLSQLLGHEFWTIVRANVLLISSL
jgi:hypothetical protein